MKKIKTIILLLFTAITFAQSDSYRQVYVEMRDTVAVAYREYFGDKWVQSGGAISREWVKDSVGLDTLRIYDFFYLDNIWVKHYIKEERFYITDRKSVV